MGHGRSLHHFLLLAAYAIGKNVPEIHCTQMQNSGKEYLLELSLQWLFRRMNLSRCTYYTAVLLSTVLCPRRVAVHGRVTANRAVPTPSAWPRAQYHQFSREHNPLPQLRCTLALFRPLHCYFPFSPPTKSSSFFPFLIFSSLASCCSPKGWALHKSNAGLCLNIKWANTIH